MPTLEGAEYEVVSGEDEPFSLKGVQFEMVSGQHETPGAVRTATSNLIRGATRSLTGPVEYVGALSGVEFLGDSARKVDEFVQDLTPVDPELADSWLATYIPQGLGQVGTMLIPGAAFFKATQGLKAASAAANAAGNVAKGAQLLAKAQKVETVGKVAIYGLMGGAEGNDAYQRSIEQGDDHAEAVAKSLGYASVAAAIENKFGTGLLIRRMEGLMGAEAAAKVLASKGLTQRVAQDVFTGAGEEGLQKFTQDIIVAGAPDAKGIFTEGGVGGIIQGLVGLPMNVAMRSMSPRQKAAIAKAEQLIKTGSPATAQFVVEDAVSSDLTEEAIGILEPGEQTKIATEQPKAAQTAPILPTPEVISNLEKGDASLTAAAVEEVATAPKPVVESDTGLAEIGGAAKAIGDNYRDAVFEAIATGKQIADNSVPVQVAREAFKRGYTTKEEVVSALEWAADKNAQAAQKEFDVAFPVRTAAKPISAPTETGAAVTPVETPKPAAPATLPDEEILFHGTNRPFSKFESGATGNAGYSRGRPVDRFYFSKNPDAAALVGEARGFKQVSVDKFADENDVTVDEAVPMLRAELQAAIDKGMRVAYMQDDGTYIWADKASELDSFEAVDSARVYNPKKAFPRLLKTKVKGKTIDLRGEYSTWPESLRQKVPKPGALDFYWHDRSPALLEWMRQNGYSKAEVKDSHESGGESIIALPEAITSFEEVESPVFPKKKAVPVKPSFTKGQRVSSDRYGQGEVLRTIGKRIQVKFDDGTKFAVSREELTAIESQAPSPDALEASRPADVGRTDLVPAGDVAGESVPVVPQEVAVMEESKGGEASAYDKMISIKERQREKQPFSVEEVQQYPDFGAQLINEGYVREGDRYVYKAEAQTAQPLNWRDAETRSPELDTAADSDLANAQREMRNLERREKRLSAKEELNDKQREELLEVQADIQEQRSVMQTYEDYQSRPAGGPPKTALEAAKEEVKDAYNGLFNMGIQPDPAAQLRFYRAIYSLAVEAVKQGVKTAAEFIAQNPFYRSVSKTMEDAFAEAQNAQPLPATLDELPPEVVHEMEIAGVNVEPRVIPKETPTKFSQSATNLLGTEWAARNPELARVIREGRYRTMPEADLIQISNDLLLAFGNDLQGALLFIKSPPTMSGVSEDIQQVMASMFITKAEQTGNIPMAQDALTFYNQIGTWSAQTLRSRQTAEKVMMDNGRPSTWVTRAENDFSQSQRAVIEPIVPVAEVQENIRQAKKEAVKALDIEKLAARFFPKAMKEMGATMRSIMEQHADSQEATRKALFDLISGSEAFDSLTPAEKLKLTNELQTLWEKARNKELERIYKAEVKDPDAAKKKLVENALPKLIKRINAGALSNEAIYNALAEEFGLPVFHEAIAKEVFRMAQEMQKAPEGLPRNQKYIDLLNYIAAQRRLSKWEMLKAYWYVSILSGTGTQATNGGAAAVNVQLQNLLLAASNPRTASKIFLGAMRGYAIGITEAGPILLRGDFSNAITNEVMTQSNPLEQAATRGGPVAKFFSNMKYVTRLMRFVDTMNAMSAFEARSYHLASMRTLDKYKDSPVTQADIDAEIFKLLNVTDAQKAHYRQVAESEAAQGIIDKRDVDRRAFDLARRARPPEIMQEALQYGKNATFNQKPVGFAGKLAESINATRTKFPLLTVVFPFVQTPANVLNELLNYTPAGLWRLAKENPVFRQKVSGFPGLNNLQARDLSPADYQILRAQVVFGHLTAIGLGLLLASYDDEEDPPFDMTGGWYGLDGDKKRQLMAQGKRKWSIKIGDTWIDYRQTPLAIMLGTLGNYQDTKKYGNERDKKLNTSSLVYHGMNGAFIVKDMTFLSGFTELINLIDPDDYVPVEKRLARFMARPITGLMPNIIQEVDSWFDPEIKRADSFLGYLQADVPVARSMMPRPMINVLGQTIRDRKNAADRFYNQAEQDPVWQELSRLSEMGVFVPVPSATAKVLQNGKRVRMTDDQVYQYRKESGRLYLQKLQRDLPRIKQMDAEQAMAYFDREFPVLRERARVLVK